MLLIESSIKRMSSDPSWRIFDKDFPRPHRLRLQRRESNVSMSKIASHFTGTSPIYNCRMFPTLLSLWTLTASHNAADDKKKNTKKKWNFILSSSHLYASDDQIKASLAVFGSWFCVSLMLPKIEISRSRSSHHPRNPQNFQIRFMWNFLFYHFVNHHFICK